LNLVGFYYINPPVIKIPGFRVIDQVEEGDSLLPDALHHELGCKVVQIDED
jgi:hypothetical protein